MPIVSAKLRRLLRNSETCLILIDREDHRSSEHGKRYHIGRIGTLTRLELAQRLGTDSIEYSTSGYSILS